MVAVVDAGWHVLGSRSGYRTISSGGIAPHDASFLEALGFGQTDDAGLIASLREQPAGMGRPLPSGRYALTRCLEGPRDSAGRRTLVFASAVFSLEDWAVYAAPAAASLLAELSTWERLVTSPGPLRLRCHVHAPSPSARDGAIAVLDRWLARDAATLAVMEDSPAATEAVLAMPSLLPRAERGAVAWAVRAMSASVPVDVCTLVPGAAVGGRRRILHVTFGPAVHPYAAAVDSFWRPGGSPPAAFCDGAETSRLSSGGVVTDIGPTRAESVRRASSGRRGPGALVLGAGAAVTAAALAVAGYAVSERSRARAEAPAEVAPGAEVPSEPLDRSDVIRPRPDVGPEVDQAVRDARRLSQRPGLNRLSAEQLREIARRVDGVELEGLPRGDRDLVQRYRAAARWLEEAEHEEAKLGNLNVVNGLLDVQDLAVVEEVDAKLRSAERDPRAEEFDSVKEGARQSLARAQEMLEADRMRMKQLAGRLRAFADLVGSSGMFPADGSPEAGGLMSTTAALASTSAPAPADPDPTIEEWEIAMERDGELRAQLSSTLSRLALRLVLGVGGFGGGGAGGEGAAGQAGTGGVAEDSDEAGGLSDRKGAEPAVTDAVRAVLDEIKSYMQQGIGRRSPPTVERAIEWHRVVQGLDRAQYEKFDRFLRRVRAEVLAETRRSIEDIRAALENAPSTSSETRLAAVDAVILGLEELRVLAPRSERSGFVDLIDEAAAVIEQAQRAAEREMEGEPR